jgi:hypothetical protein
MRSHLKINIKGRRFWKLFTLVGIAIFLACCDFLINNIQQPLIANAGDVININTRDSVFTNVNGGGSITANYIAGILMPKGWAGAANTTVTYTSNLGDGNMQLMPATVLEPESINNGTNLNYSQAMLKKFGIGGNLVNDLEWVVFRSVQQVNIGNTITILGNINFKIKVGVDGNTTIYKPAYVICESVDGLNHWNATTPDYGYANGARMTVNGPGDVNDLCDPQLTSFDPPKVLNNDIVTLSYNEKLDTVNTLKGTKLYLCVDTAYTSDGKKLTGFCTQSTKTLLTQTTANSGLYKLTFWPSAFFGLTAAQTVTKMVYYITDANGNKVGLGDTSTPFTYKFSCN